jgi:hypothetical protein
MRPQKPFHCVLEVFSGRTYVKVKSGTSLCQIGGSASMPRPFGPDRTMPSVLAGF